LISCCLLDKKLEILQFPWEEKKNKLKNKNYQKLMAENSPLRTPVRAVESSLRCTLKLYLHIKRRLIIIVASSFSVPAHVDPVVAEVVSALQAMEFCRGKSSLKIILEGDYLQVVSAIKNKKFIWTTH
jgi:hypothetical protein